MVWLENVLGKAIDEEIDKERTRLEEVRKREEEEFLRRQEEEARVC